MYFGWQMHIFQAVSKATLFTLMCWSPRSQPGHPPLSKWQFYLKNSPGSRTGAKLTVCGCGWGWGPQPWSLPSPGQIQVRAKKCDPEPAPARPCLDSPDLMTGISQVKKELWSGQQHIPELVFTQKYNLIFYPRSEPPSQQKACDHCNEERTKECEAPERKKCRVWSGECRDQQSRATASLLNSSMGIWVEI